MHQSHLMASSSGNTNKISIYYIDCSDTNDQTVMKFDCYFSLDIYTAGELFSPQQNGFGPEPFCRASLFCNH